MEVRSSGEGVWTSRKRFTGARRNVEPVLNAFILSQMSFSHRGADFLRVRNPVFSIFS
jgi:hypothetical protein